MGIKFGTIIKSDKSSLQALSNKIVAVDAFNAVYQFLASIRGIDGTPLMDSKSRITSHISGLFYRNVNFLSLGIRPVYCFDGKPPFLKKQEIARRAEVKKEARIKHEKAVSEGNNEDAKKFATQSTSLTRNTIPEAKELLDLFGIPYINAISEGEATAADLTRTGQADFCASQDFDSLLFGAKKVVRNFTNSGTRKHGNTYVKIDPEIIDFQNVLDELKLSREQLVDVAILLGTDFNAKFDKMGPKTAIKVIQKHSKLENVPNIQEKLKEIQLEQIRKIFLEPKVTKVETIKFREVNYDGLIDYLVNERSFAKSRIETALEKMKKQIEELK